MAVNKVRRNGSYAPLSAHYYKDDAIDEAGEAAELLYVRGLAFCADVLSDGFISDRQLVRFVGVGMFDAPDRATRLVEVGLWQRAEGGYWVRSWLDWNRSRAEITDQQARDAARKRPPAESGRPDPEPPNDPPPRPDRESERNPNGIQSEGVSESDGLADPTPSGVQPRAGARARTPLHSTPRKKDSSADADVPDRFAEFYAAYPRRCQRRRAEQAWKAALNRGATPDVLIGAARSFARQVGGRETRFVPHPATWLNSDAFADEPEQAHLSLVPDLPLSGDPVLAFDELRRCGDARASARLLGIPWVEPSQRPSDPTPPQEWLHARRVEFIDRHESEIRAALTKDRAAC